MKNIINKIKNLTVFDKILIGSIVIAVIFFAYTFFRKSTYITITVKVGEDSVSWERSSRAWFSQLFYEGMKEKDGLGRVNAEVLGVRSYDTTYSRKAVYLTTKLKVVYSRSSNQYNYKGLAVLIGAPVKMYLDKMFVEGLVIHIEGVKDPREKQTLIVEAQIREENSTYLETSGTKEYIADALKAGEEIKDDQGNTVIKILKKKVESAKKVVTTSDGRVVIKTDPLKKDVYLTLQVEAFELHNRYFIFDDVPILIGDGIPINSPFITVWPVVTKIAVSQ